MRCACGSDLFIESTRVSGWWKSLIDGAGESVDTDLDSLKYEPAPKTVRCAECGRRHPNPRRLEQGDGGPADQVGDPAQER